MSTVFSTFQPNPKNNGPLLQSTLLCIFLHLTRYVMYWVQKGEIGRILPFLETGVVCASGTSISAGVLVCMCVSVDGLNCARSCACVWECEKTVVQKSIQWCAMQSMEAVHGEKTPAGTLLSLGDSQTAKGAITGCQAQAEGLQLSHGTPSAV